ncbi:MAG: hypothetical protein JOY77_13690 [Alphaproteobacteria bacterium]|nr:hypothetical protein [Alphaproteobacteria bacterium]MBV9063960.1 hypothetical protein [Alphaproteobacteria bacterium]
MVSEAEGRPGKRERKPKVTDVNELESRVKIAELRAREAEAELRLREASAKMKVIRSGRKETKTRRKGTGSAG